MAKIHGNVFTLWVLNHPVVVLQGFQAVKEGLTVHAEDVAGRPTSPFFHVLTLGNGNYYFHKLFLCVLMLILESDLDVLMSISYTGKNNISMSFFMKHFFCWNNNGRIYLL